MMLPRQIFTVVCSSAWLALACSEASVPAGPSTAPATAAARSGPAAAPAVEPPATNTASHWADGVALAPVALKPAPPLQAGINLVRLYTVQLAAYTSGAVALKVANQALHLGYPVQVTAADLGEQGLWYRVRAYLASEREVAEGLAVESTANKELAAAINESGSNGFKPVVVELEGIDANLERFLNLNREADEPLLPPGAKVAALPASLFGGVLALAALPGTGEIVALSRSPGGGYSLDALPGQWEKCGGCSSLPQSGPGFVAQRRFASVLMRLDPAAGPEVWLEATIDGVHQAQLAYRLMAGKWELVAGIVVQEVRLPHGRVERKLRFSDLDNDGLREILVEETSREIEGQALCQLSRAAYLYASDGVIWRRWDPEDLLSPPEFALPAEKLRRWFDGALQAGLFRSAATVLLELARRELLAPEELQREYLRFNLELAAAGEDALQLELEIAALRPLPDKSLSAPDAVVKKLREVIDRARVVHYPDCRGAALLRPFEAGRAAAMEERYLHLTQGMLSPRRLSPAVLSRLAGILRQGGPAVAPLRETWEMILRREAPATYNLLRQQLEMRHEPD